MFLFRHLNKTEHDLLYPNVAKQQGGAFCNHCGATKRSLKKVGKDSKFIIDRKNRKAGYWLQDTVSGKVTPNIKNLQLVCKGCNKRKEYERPRQKPPEDRPMTPEMMVNRSKEPYFRKWVHGIIEVEGKLEWDEAVESGAEFVGVSIPTTRRYLKKMVSKSGDYILGPGKNGGTYLYDKQKVQEQKKEIETTEVPADPE